MNLRGVGRRYGFRGPWVVRGVDLDLAARTLVRVEGANGSGKSTLLRLLAGIDRPTEGRLTGRPRTASVPERFPVSLPFTAGGYLVHLGRIHVLRRTVAEARAAEWLERFGAAGHSRTPMSELSKGTSQKVAVAQALLAGPELLVLDQICVTQEPPAARTVAAAKGTSRAHLAALLAAVVFAGVLGTAGTLAVTVISEPRNTDHTVEGSLLAARVAGLVAAAVCLLLGAAVGAPCGRPLLRGRGWPLIATLLVVLPALVGNGSPAKYAITGLVTGSRTGVVQVPGLPLAAAALMAAAAGAVACAVATRRS
ncbi:ATP-binding cassette domain-containing protein [Streptomyces sp. NPDC102274]|uniref:ATP-binding cassette domain-containing protein n=1 Tax=Streptomyces sp. NPDC102274 TaxID=3366151 RepID=UPI0038005743